jgi:type II secretory pathway pseudopilin PulG
MIINHLCIRWPGSRTTRTGTTLLELCVVLAVMSALLAIALPRLREAGDRAAARSAIQEASSLFSLGRRAAVTRRAAVGVVIDSIAGSIVVRIGSTVIARRGLRAQYGVRITVSRDSMSYDPRGFGYGAANLSVVARRGRAAETLFVSRLGRTRH